MNALRQIEDTREPRENKIELTYCCECNKDIYAGQAHIKV